MFYFHPKLLILVFLLKIANYKSKNKYSININIDVQNNENNKLLNIIDINNIQTLFNSKKDENINILYSAINKNINLDMLFDKKFIMYPIFW